MNRTRRYRRIAATSGLIVASLALYAAMKFHRPSGDASRVEPRSLAILPFQNLKNDAENDFLGFSLADAVITKLGPVQVPRRPPFLRCREVPPKADRPSGRSG